MQTTIQLTFASAAAAAAFLATLPAEGAAAVTPPAGNVKATTPAATTPEVRYYHNAASDTVFELKKGDKPPAGASGSTNISQHEYEGHKARLAQKYLELQKGASGAPGAGSASTTTAAAEFDPFADDAAPVATVTEVDEPTLVGKLQELAKFPADGRALLMSWIERAGAKGVPAMVKAMDGKARGQMFADANKHMGVA